MAMLSFMWYTKVYTVKLESTPKYVHMCVCTNGNAQLSQAEFQLCKEKMATQVFSMAGSGYSFFSLPCLWHCSFPLTRGCREIG